MSREVKIGILVVICLFALYWGINFLKGRDIIGSTNSYYVVYQQVADLQKSAPVLVHGYKVGTVDNISLDKNNPSKILVELAVDKSIKIPKTTVAEIYNADFMGTKAIRLQFEGYNIPASRGDTLLASVAPSVLDDLSPITKKVDIALQELTQTLVNINTLLDPESIENLKATFANLNSATQNANYILNQNRNKISLVIDQASNLVASLNQSSQDIKVITSNFRAFSDSLSPQQVSQILSNIEITSQELKVVMKEINGQTGTLGKMIYDPSLHNQLLKLSSSIDSLAVDLRKNPKRYLKFSVF